MNDDDFYKYTHTHKARKISVKMVTVIINSKILWLFKYLFNLIFIVCSMINMFHNRKFIIKKVYYLSKTQTPSRFQRINGISTVIKILQKSI